jgi:hypothetical protein
MAPDVERVHHTILAETLSVESEFKFLPSNLPTPRVKFVRICPSSKVRCCGSSRRKATHLEHAASESLWRRADQKWHAYPAAPQVGSIEAFLKLVAVDKHACFFVSAVA